MQGRGDGGTSVGAEGDKAPAGASSALWAAPLQRCLIQVGFRPVLPGKLIHQEASQALTKPVEVKLVHGDSQEEGRGDTEQGLWLPAPPPRLQGARPSAFSSAGWTLWSMMGVSFQSVSSSRQHHQAAEVPGGRSREKQVEL